MLASLALPGTLLGLVALALSAPTGNLSPRSAGSQFLEIQGNQLPIAGGDFGHNSAACFVIGSLPLPSSTKSTVAALLPHISCNHNRATVSGVPDVSSHEIAFSSVNFADAALAQSQTPLEFSLAHFAAAQPLSSSDLPKFRDWLKVYEATEAGVRSVGGDLKIEVPKWFLRFQIARIEAARGFVRRVGNAGTDTIDGLLGKVLASAAGEDKDLLDKVVALGRKVR